MATPPDTSTADRALVLLDWLVGLDLPLRTINPLRRDLEVALGRRQGAQGKGPILRGLGQAQFVVELYRDEGGLIRQVPSLGALAIEVLRDAIPPPRAAPAAAPPSDEGWREFELDEPPPAAEAPPTIEATAPPVPRRGRPRRGAQAGRAPAPPAPPVAQPEADEAQIRRLLRRLHPQGRRAVLGFIAEQLVAPSPAGGAPAS